MTSMKKTTCLVPLTACSLTAQKHQDWRPILTICFESRRVKAPGVSGSSPDAPSARGISSIPHFARALAQRPMWKPGTSPQSKPRPCSRRQPRARRRPFARPSILRRLPLSIPSRTGSVPETIVLSFSTLRRLLPRQLPDCGGQHRVRGRCRSDDRSVRVIGATSPSLLSSVKAGCQGRQRSSARMSPPRRGGTVLRFRFSEAEHGRSPLFACGPSHLSPATCIRDACVARADLLSSYSTSPPLGLHGLGGYAMAEVAGHGEAENQLDNRKRAFPPRAGVCGHLIRRGLRSRPRLHLLAPPARVAAGLSSDDVAAGPGAFGTCTGCLVVIMEWSRWDSNSTSGSGARSA